MKKVAIIDIGTNSMRLMIATINNGQIVDREKTLETTRMGQGIDKNGYLSGETIERNFAALKKFVGIAHKQKIEKIVAFATSALRDASNREEFIHKVEKELSLEIQLLSGEREAEIGFKGVMGEIDTERLLVIDIGGGSTEFILGSKKEGIESLTSINIGALRMTEKFIAHDPISAVELKDLEKNIKEQLLPLKEKLSLMEDAKIVGIAGTITTLSAMKQQMEYYDWRKIHQSTLSFKEIAGILQQLIPLNIEERKKIKGLQPKRADIIIAGIVILKCIMEVFAIESIMISESDNLEGMVYELLDLVF
ncbi:Ppx/GppA family phosphatase [Irregularibacter muris]|uniref:Ppx/GppA family phosphatase n=1 Tax=Irregularibacter muris TaxID=1796619 RepID=A0AAE3KZR5_9FIRM|nr:Ppx/GppA phosphatase family protein [Irregularibacter muris]MCR1899041.1 Ppx/GppA family phosphatase [Irregularibacter muris]